jgi:hypothetical protein
MHPLDRSFAEGFLSKLAELAAENTPASASPAHPDDVPRSLWRELKYPLAGAASVGLGAAGTIGVLSALEDRPAMQYLRDHPRFIPGALAASTVAGGGLWVADQMLRAHTARAVEEERRRSQGAG